MGFTEVIRHSEEGDLPQGTRGLLKPTQDQHESDHQSEDWELSSF